MAAGRFVSYLRVSTARQGASGLGLEAQRAAVAAYLGGDAVIEEFVEIESGKRNDRPVLARALAACRRHRAVLVIAKLDRLARNAAFLLSLRDAGIEFVAADMPHTNRMVVGVMALVAEQEREAISVRTKAALQAARERGVVLGKPENLTNRGAGTIRSAAVRSAAADARVRDLGPVVAEIMAAGSSSLNAIAKALTERAIPTPAGRSSWSPTQVKNLLARLDDLRAPELVRASR